MFSTTDLGYKVQVVAGVAVWVACVLCFKWLWGTKGLIAGIWIGALVSFLVLVAPELFSWRDRH